MSQVTDNLAHGPDDSRAMTPQEAEIVEQRFQERNLRLIRGLVFAVVPVLLSVGGLLYYGNELPPWSMRDNQATDSTGYQPPPGRYAVVAGAVPRTGVPKAYPDLADGSVPAEAARLSNPLAGDPKRLTTGKIVYTENCAFCHGVNGLGDGPAGESYVPRPTDLTNRTVQSRSEGTMFYKITNGILSTPIPETKKYLPREWHAFRGTLSERERWAVVAYIRSFRESGADGPAKPAGQ